MLKYCNKENDCSYVYVKEKPSLSDKQTDVRTSASLVDDSPLQRLCICHNSHQLSRSAPVRSFPVITVDGSICNHHATRQKQRSSPESFVTGDDRS